MTFSSETDREPMSEARLPGVGDVLLGKYRIDGHIGEGGMGVVLEAYHLKLAQSVALKLLHPSAVGLPDAVARFAREGRAAARLSGPHVARVYDVEETPEGLPFLVMERLRGEDLATQLARQGRIPPEQAVGFILEACEGLAEAHAKGVVHRDLKPENLYLAQAADGSTVLKLLDFGISKLLFGQSESTAAPTLPLGAATPASLRFNSTHPSTPANGLVHMALTSAQSLMGTPRYMSPEQALSPLSVDQRADIWSLGVILYQLLVGRTPFDGDNASALLMSIALDALPEFPRDLNVPPGVVEVVKRCLMKEKTDRYADVLSLAQALQPFGGARAAEHVERVGRYVGRPVLVAAPSVPHKPSRSKSNKWLLVVAAAALACGSAWFMWRRSTNVASSPPAAPAQLASPAAESSAAKLPAPSASPTPAAAVDTPPASDGKNRAAPPREGSARSRNRNPLRVDIQR